MFSKKTVRQAWREKTTNKLYFELIEVTLHYGNRLKLQKRQAENGLGPSKCSLRDVDEVSVPYGILLFVAEAGLEPATLSL